MDAAILGLRFAALANPSPALEWLIRDLFLWLGPGTVAGMLTSLFTGSMS
jgi:hypothetical protein